MADPDRILEAAQKLHEEELGDGVPGMVTGAVLILTVITGEDGPDGQIMGHFSSDDLPIWTEIGLLEMALARTRAQIEDRE